MSLSILQVCNPGGYYLPLCSVCASFLSGEFPHLKGDEEHAIHLVYCLEELESVWGKLSSIDLVRGVLFSASGGVWSPKFEFFHKTCGLCMESGPVIVAVVDFEEVTQ